MTPEELQLERDKLRALMQKNRYRFWIATGATIGPIVVAGIQLWTAYLQHQVATEAKAQAEVAAVKAEEVGAAVANVERKVDSGTEVLVPTAAINAKWWAERTGDPLDMSRAEDFQARLESRKELLPAMAAPTQP